MSMTIFGMATVVYFILHSLFAADGVKAGMSRILPARYYRVVFNLLAAGMFIGLTALYFLVEKTPLWESNLPVSLLGAVPVLFGLSWTVGALKKYNMDEFLGLEQLRSDQKPQHTKLIIRGLNGKVRHPLYFGSLLIIWGFVLFLPTDAMLAFALISTIYLIIGSRLEEQKLVAQFGKAYLSYQKEVPMLLPFKFRLK